MKHMPHLCCCSTDLQSQLVVIDTPINNNTIVEHMLCIMIRLTSWSLCVTQVNSLQTGLSLTCKHNVMHSCAINSVLEATLSYAHLKSYKAVTAIWMTSVNSHECQLCYTPGICMWVASRPRQCCNWPCCAYCMHYKCCCFQNAVLPKQLFPLLSRSPL